MLFAGSMMAQTFTGDNNPQLLPNVGTSGGPTTSTAVSNTGGLVGTDFLIDNVTINLNHTFDGDLNIELISPSGTTHDLSSGNGGSGDNYSVTVFQDGAASITGGSAPFNGTYGAEGGSMNDAFAGEPASGNWTVSIFDNFGGDSGNWSTFSITLSPACQIATPAPIVVNNDSGICGAFVSVVATAPLCADPLTNDQTAGGGDASGVYPVGTTTVTFSSGQSSATTTVTVIDTEAPTFACPGDMTIHLDPGACDQVVSYSAIATDNCPLVGPLVSLTTNNDFNAAVTNSVACGGGGYQTLLAYDLPAMGVTTDLFIESVDFGIFQIFGNVGLTVNVYSIASAPGETFNYADLTLLGTGTQNFGGQGNGFGNIPVSGTIPAGTVVVLELVAPNGSFTNGFVPGYNNLGLTSGVSYLASNFCNVPNPQAIGQVLAGFPDVAAMQLNANAPLDPLQTSGIASGEAFPIGTTTNTYEITDGAGNSATCTWSVTVVENTATTNDITCNSLVNVSLDENCASTVGADQILEGNNYGCYDNFDVVFAATGLPLVLDGSHVGQTIEVMVTNPSGNQCWGYILVEDKLIPELICADANISCDDDTTPGVTLPAGTVSESVEEGGSWPSTGDFDNTFEVGAVGTVTDVNVSLDITHTWVGDLTVSITSPSGTSVTIFGGSCGIDDNVDATFDDESANAFNCGGTPIINGDMNPQNPFSVFDGELAMGVWTVNVTDQVGGDGGNINNITLEVSHTAGELLPFPVPAGVAVIPAGANTWTLIGFDPCGPATLTSVDVESGELCAGDAQIVRTWTVTDGSGNTTSCTETISITPTTLADVVADLPTDIVLECGDAIPALLTDIGCDNIGITLASEITIDICEGSYKLLRNYILVDWCDNSTLEHLQIIKVLDTQAPTVNAIADLTISTNSNNCFGAVQLPTATATDECSSVTVAVTSSSAGTLNGNLLTDLAVGTHTVTYTATDGCGNESTGDLTITVEDQIAPIAICDEHTILGIGSDGTASINAITFDDGSYDNCGIVEMTARRMDNPACPGFDGTNFAASVPFFCCDVNTVVMVEFRVRDAAGNVNSCMVEVEVQDKIDPTVICPADAAVECDATYLDYIVVGQPLPQDAVDANGTAIASDNCPGVSLTNNVIGNTVECGNGTITVVWTATDAQGSTSSCIQRYFVANNNPFTAGDITWPLDYTATTCGTGLEPGDLSSPYDYPVADEGACNNVAIGHHDQVLDFGVADACLKVLRKWYVIDWCQAGANVDPTQPGPGVWHHTQIIKVINSNDPTVTVVDFPAVIDNYDANCESTSASFVITADDDCTAPADLQVTWEFSTGLSGSGLTASGAFFNGSYSLTYTVSDGCNNTVWEIHEFTVVDAKQPTPVCIFGIATTVMPSAGAVTIWASDFESGSSYDNCTSYGNLEFSFSQDVTDINITISCDDIPADGLFPITLYVTDEAGNFDFCSTFISVQDPNGACVGPTATPITGTIANENQEVIEEVIVTLSNTGGAMGLPVVTSSNGTYSFNGNTSASYDVTPGKDINYLNGVTTYDLVLISKHILGTEVLDSPYKMIAADANNTASITTLDIVKLRALILHIDDELAANTSWRFVDANHVFGTNVFDFPEYVSPTVNGSIFNPANFMAVKVGDVNGTASPNSLLGSDSRTFAGELALSLEATQVAAGETFTVDFNANEFKNIAGYQFTLGFDNSAVEFVDVTSNLEGLDVANFGLTKLSEGVITTSWNSNEGVTVANGSALFSMTFRATAAVNTKELLSINSRYTESEAYSNSDLYNVVLEFNGTTVSNGFELFQNTPNPFKAETTIGFTMPTAGAVTLTIYDVSGRTLRLIEMDAVKGANSVNVTRDGIDATGVLYYQLETATETATKKMILVD